MKKIFYGMIIVMFLSFAVVLADNCGEDHTLGIVSYWKTDGDATDYVNENDGVVNGATFTGGKVGTGLYLDGNDYIEVPDNESLHIPVTLSIEMWVNPSTSQYDRVLISKGNSGVGDGWHLMLRTGNTLAFHGRYGSLWEITETIEGIPIGEWHHVAYTYDGTVAKLVGWDTLEGRVSHVTLVSFQLLVTL